MNEIRPQQLLVATVCVLHIQQTAVGPLRPWPAETDNYCVPCGVITPLYTTFVLKSVVKVN